MDKPKWFLKRSQKKNSIKHEKRVAELVDGERTFGSGMFPHLKGDVHTGEYFLECKVSTKQSYALSLKRLKKLDQEAKKANKIPVMFITLRDGRQRYDYALLKASDFLELKV